MARCFIQYDVNLGSPYLLIYRFCPDQVVVLIDHSIITWLLTCVCAPHCIRNPYVTAKLVEVLFVTSPSIQPNSPLQANVSLNNLAEFFEICNINNNEFRVLREELRKYSTKVDF